MFIEIKIPILSVQTDKIGIYADINIILTPPLLGLLKGNWWGSDFQKIKSFIYRGMTSG